MNLGQGIIDLQPGGGDIRQFKGLALLAKGNEFLLRERLPGIEGANHAVLAGPQVGSLQVHNPVNGAPGIQRQDVELLLAVQSGQVD